MSNDNPIVHDVRTGYLGWSNVRGGLEFYRGDGENNRWKPRESKYHADSDPSSGVLLQDDLENDKLGEGSVCVVITLDTRDLVHATNLANELIDAFKRATKEPKQ